MRRMLAFFTVLGLVLAMTPVARAALETSWRTQIVAASNDVAIGPGGAVYVVGQGPPGAKPWDKARATVTRLTTAGDVVWSRAWQPHPEHPSLFLTNAVAVDVADNGVVYVAGAVQRHNCEGGGWFIRAYGPNGRFLAMTAPQPVWYCRHPGPFAIRDVTVRGDLVVAAVAATGCCGESAVLDGYVRGFTRDLNPRWRTNFEPPAPARRAWYDVPDSVAIAGNGAIYAAGWAAIEGSNGVTTPAGALTVQKIGHGGNKVWSKRPGVPMGYDGPVSMAFARSRILVGAQMRGGGIWLAQLDLFATPQWHRTWGDDPRVRAQLGGIEVGATGRTWMVGTRRDGSDDGTNPFVRRYAPTGVLAGQLTIDLKTRWVDGNAVAMINDVAFPIGTKWVRSTGRLLSGEVWRVHV